MPTIDETDLITPWGAYSWVIHRGCEIVDTDETGAVASVRVPSTGKVYRVARTPEEMARAIK